MYNLRQIFNQPSNQAFEFQEITSVYDLRPLTVRQVAEATWLASSDLHKF